MSELLFLLHPLSLRRVLRNSNGQPLILLRQIAVGNFLTSDWFFYQSKVPWTGRSGFNRSGLGAARSWAKHLSNATLSASKLMVQVNAKLLRKIAPNPSWFFSNDCPASIHERAEWTSFQPALVLSGIIPKKVSCLATS